MICKPFQFSVLFGLHLRVVVVGAQLRDEIGGVLGGVDGQTLGYDEKRVGELGDGELFARAHRRGEVLQIDGQRRLDTAAARHQLPRLEHTLDHAQRVMYRTLHLVAVVVVRAAQDYRRRRSSLRTITHTHIINIQSFPNIFYKTDYPIFC